MNRRDVESGINRSWAFLERLSLAESFSNPAPLGVNEEFRDLVLNASSSYQSIYMYALQNSHYNILTSDYSFFQYSWEGSDNVRFAFYANPFSSSENSTKKFRGAHELFGAGLIDLEQYYALLNDAGPELRVPLVRYENAPSQYKTLKHPCSHLHIGHHAENRWAVRRVLTPSAFTMFLCKMYFPVEWNMLDDTLGDKFEDSLDCKLIEEREGCRIIGDGLFSELEARSFHFG